MRSKVNSSKATPDQDQRVLKAINQMPPLKRKRYPVMTAIIAAGVDSPPNAESLLLRANALYYNLKDDEHESVRGWYADFKMDGSNPESDRYGKTPLSWLQAINGATGIVTIPLPKYVVLDRKNPWDPFVRTPVSGIFIMEARSHWNALQ